MNIIKIGKLLKKRKRLHLLEDADGNQWVGEGRAFYILEGLPKMSAASILQIIGVDDKKKWLAWENAWPAGLDLKKDGKPITRITGIQYYSGDDYAPFVYEREDKKEILWILCAYLAPLHGLDEVEGFVHALPGGDLCVVVKSGMFPVAFIGEDGLCCDENFVDRLRLISGLSLDRHNRLNDAGKTGEDAMENEVFDFGEALGVDLEEDNAGE